MPKEKAEKSLCMSGLRHAEYYGMQEVFDGLYAKSSKNETFTNLMNIILKRENILLAYRNIKSNDGSKTPGTDGVTFDDIGKLMPFHYNRQYTWVSSETCPKKRNTKTLRPNKNQAAGNPLRLGPAGTTMYQAGHGADL